MLFKRNRKPEEDPYKDTPLHLVEPLPFEVWSNGRIVVFTGGSRTSDIAKAHVLLTDEQAADFNASFRRQEQEEVRLLDLDRVDKSQASAALGDVAVEPAIE